MLIDNLIMCSKYSYYLLDWFVIIRLEKMDKKSEGNILDHSFIHLYHSIFKTKNKREQEGFLPTKLSFYLIQTIVQINY